MTVRHYQSNGEETYAGKRTRPPMFPLLYAGVLAALLYSVFLVVNSVWVGAEASQKLQRRQAELGQMKLQLEVQKRYVEYQKTPHYREKQARKHFGYAKEGETVVILPQNVDSSQRLQDEQAAIEALSSERVSASHLQQWWNYFFGERD